MVGKAKVIVLVSLAVWGASICGARAEMNEAEYDKALAERFQYGPPPPPAETADLPAGRALDAAYFAKFLELDRSYGAEAREKARRLATRFAAEAGSLTQEQAVLRVAEIAALADNAHTNVAQNAFAKNTPRVPLRTYWFKEGLFVLRADPGNARLLGARIDEIDGRRVADVSAALSKYFGGISERRRRMTQAVLESPGLLYAAGLAHSAGKLTLKGRLLNGERFEADVGAESRGRSAPVSQTSQLLFPATAGAPMKSLLSASQDLPVSLQESGKLFLIRPLGADGLYVRIAHNADTDEEPIAPFLDRVVDAAASPQIAYVVLDMRMNGGGDYTTTYAFAKRLVDRTPAKAKIYVLTSPWTFSAAINAVATLKQFGGAKVVIAGEPVGDRLRFWAEGGTMWLPNIFVAVTYSAGLHDYQNPCLDREKCFWLNERFPVRVRSLEPEIPVDAAFSMYAQGRDGVLEEVMNREKDE